MSELVRAVEVSRRYGGVTALAGVSLSIAAGEVVAIAGPSGSGKTTLLAILGGLDEPTEGRVLLGGQDFYALGRAARARLRAAQIGFVFQTHNLLGTLTAEENVSLAVRHGGVHRDDPRGRAAATLGQLGLARAARRLPRALSLGEQQRVAVARALAAGPPLLIADEPTASLDGASGRTVLEALTTAARAGCAVVLASHDERCLAASTRVLHLRDGALTA